MAEQWIATLRNQPEALASLKTYLDNEELRILRQLIDSPGKEIEYRGAIFQIRHILSTVNNQVAFLNKQAERESRGLVE